jgi:H+/Cl- antiporter ClcA
MALALLLHLIQHLAYGYSLNTIVSPESFLDGVTHATPARRFVVVAGCGLLAGVGWEALRRWGKPLVSISNALKSNDPRLPIVSTIVHACLQIITVALGSPLGREVAPREIGALFAGHISRYAGLSVRDAKIMVACGAGAGLAAVYNVPVAATIFVVEVLLRSARPAILVPAAITCVTAAFCARIGLGDESQYVTSNLSVSAPLVAFAVVLGPFFGFAGYTFKKAMLHAQSRAPKGIGRVFGCIAAFLVVALLALRFPELLGNGKGPAQMTFSDTMDPRFAIILIALKVAIIALVLRGGARGGLLTPGLAIGALLATVMGSAWNLFLPNVPLGAFSIIGASAFLGSSMTMPLTAIALMVELMHLPTIFLLPLSLAAIGATLSRVSLQRRALHARPTVSISA